MSIRTDGTVIHLEGVVGVEEAETLAARLAEGGRVVDLSACDGAHSAVVQAILSFRPELQGEPRAALLRDRVVPALLSAMREQGHGKPLALKTNGGPAKAPARSSGASE